jgi:DUF4097 and DUF4098 domain-containing protein YvlB
MYEFDRSSPVTVALRVHGGLVEIVAEDRLTTEVTVSPMDGGDKSREIAEKTRVVLEDDALLVQVPGAEYWSWRRTPKLAITVKVPAGSAVAGKSASAGVRARGVYSMIQLDVSSADVEIEEVTGDCQLEAASGDLSVGKVGGSLRIKSSSGRLRIGDVTGDVNADTASGHIGTGAIGGSVHAKTASGDIEIGSVRQGQARVTAASGDIKVGVAPGTGVWLDVDTASGRSTSDLSMNGESVPEGNTAALELYVRTSSGDITVHRAFGQRKAAA